MFIMKIKMFIFYISKRSWHKLFYDKRDVFNFHIVNFLFLYSNIAAAVAYLLSISQLIRYSRTCYSYHDFLD